MIVLVIIGAPVALGYYLGLGMASWALGILAGGIWYARDVKRHPRVRCRVCTGSGDEKSQIGGGKWLRNPFGDCWCCGGKKAHPRPALRLIDPGQHRSIKAEIARAKGKA